jgi:hypothetical protein
MNTPRALLCSCLTLLACVPAAAQTQQQPTRPERPYRGVFASGVEDAGQSLTANTSLSGGYDDNILADATQRNTFQNSQQGTLGQFSGSLNYSLIGARGSLNAGAGTSVRYYPSLENEFFKTYNAGIGGDLRVLQKPDLIVRQSVNYQPFTFLSGLSGFSGDPGLEPLLAPVPEFVPISSHYVAYESGADLTAQLTRRVSFLSSYTYRLADRTSRVVDGPSTRFWRQSGTMGLTFGVSRDLSLRTAYRYVEGHYPGRVVRMHSPDIGLDFRRALSLTRRTSLTFGVGTEATVVREQARYRATGNVNVAHEIGRTWQADASYQRGTQFVDTLPEPVFGDTARVGLSGLISRRVQFQAAAGATIGNSGFDVQRQFDSYRGTISMSTALNRFMNVGVDYVYYRYMFDPLTVLEPGLPHEVNRQSIRAHVSFWAPLMNRTRRSDATR